MGKLPYVFGRNSPGRHAHGAFVKVQDNNLCLVNIRKKNSSFPNIRQVSLNIYLENMHLISMKQLTFMCRNYGGT